MFNLNRRTSCALLGLFAAASLTLPGIANGAQIYVASGGNDSNDGSINSPLASVQAAVDSASPGDTIYLRGGTYMVTESNGGDIDIRTPNLVLRSYPGEWAHINAPVNDPNLHQTLHLHPNANGTVIQDLEVSGGFYYAIKLESDWSNYPTREQATELANAASYVTIRDSKLHDSGRDVIKLAPAADYVRIINNEIYRSGQRNNNNAEGIDAVNADHVLIQGNYIHDIATTGAYIKGGSKHGRLSHNLVVDVGISPSASANSRQGLACGYQTDAEFFDADNTLFYGSFECEISNNIILNTGGAGILVAGSNGAKVLNNTVYNAVQNPTVGFNGAISIYRQKNYIPEEYVTQNHDLTLLNNLVVVAADDGTGSSPRSYALAVRQRTEGAGQNYGVSGSLWVDYNYYARLGNNRLDQLFTSHLWGNIHANDSDGTPSYDINKWQQYWQLEENANASFTIVGDDIDSHSLVPGALPNLDQHLHLQSDSLAIDAGLYIEGLSDDIDAQSRDSLLDIGADEYASQVPTTVPPDAATIGAGYPVNQTPDEQVPEAPMNLFAELQPSNNGGTNVLLSWDKSADNTGISYYRIMRNGVFAGLSTVNRFRDVNQPEGNNSYEVEAIDPANNVSALSVALSVAVPAGDTPAPTPPSPPPADDDPSPPETPDVDHYPLANGVSGIEGVFPQPDTIVDVDTAVYLQMSAEMYLYEQDTGTLDVIERNSGNIVQQFDPSSSNTEQGRTLALPVTLQTGTEYCVVASPRVVRLNGSPWQTGAINLGDFCFTTAGSNSDGGNEQPPSPPQQDPVDNGDFAPLTPEVSGIVGVSPAPGSVVSAASSVRIQLAASMYHYAGDQNAIYLADQLTGEIRAFDPDEQNSGTGTVLTLPFTLEAGREYCVSAERHFVRINAAPWNVQAIPQDSYCFATDLAAPPVSVAAITGIAPAPGSVGIPIADLQMKVRFSASTYLGYTSGRSMQIIEQQSGTLIAEIDPEPGYQGEGSDELTFPIQSFEFAPGQSLQANTRYCVALVANFSRVNAAPWNSGQLSCEDGWWFETAN
ncbi:MAG: right-handed parallel beta-helix repeat-containing protein [Aestuariibacter sp.]